MFSRFIPEENRMRNESAKIRVLVPLAEGAEELEAVTIIDLLRRAGFSVIVAGLHDGPVRCSRGTVLVPDTTLSTLQEADNPRFDLIVLPGGLPGADHLRDDTRLRHLLLEQAAEKRLIAAICAAPKVLEAAGLLAGKRFTAYTGSLERLSGESTGASVEIDAGIVTGRGPGTAMELALTLIEQLAGPGKRREVEKPLLR
jgi:4-methyl-5(b-hydroxyethyl)-thiazole monophosphate biosynthesis